MSIWKPKPNPLYEVALNKIEDLAKALSSGNRSLIRNKWMPILPDNPKSPLIMGMSENEHLIYYPPFSTPYEHKFETSIKTVEILSGKVTDMVTKKVYKTGDKTKIYPGDEPQPYTGEEPAYVKVTITHIDDIWQRICDR